MTLKTLFVIPIAVILLVTLSLAGMIAGQGWSGLARGREAGAAVERMGILLTLQGQLVEERITTNIVLSAPYPLPLALQRRLAKARLDTDHGVAALVANLHARDKGLVRPGPRLIDLVVRIGMARAATDALLAQDLPDRTYAALNAVMPLMLGPTVPLEQRLAAVTLEVIAAEPNMAGLLTISRIGTTLRDQLSSVAGELMPRFNRGEQMTQAEVLEVHRLLAVASELTGLLAKTIEIADPTERMRNAVADLKRADDTGELLTLSDVMNTGPVGGGGAFPQPQRILIPWGKRIETLRAAVLDATVSRVANEETLRERRLHLVMVAFGAVLIAVMESIALLSHRVVIPLAQLGLAIKQIAAGARETPLNMRSGTREITEMAMAVETLRHAALIADAASTRQRMAARQRLLKLREALGIAQTVREPARALELDVARLSEGIDATIALVATTTSSPPDTLGFAATAVRTGLEIMRQAAAGLDATFAAAHGAETEDRPPAEFVAYIRAVEEAVERRGVAVRSFVQPSLLALRDTTSAQGVTTTPVLRDLVSDQFNRIETTVATVASMRAAVERAASIVRDLPLDDTPIAA